MDRRAFLGTASVVGAVGLGGCLGSGQEATGEYDFGMSARRYDPGAVQVSPGTTVVWQNTSSAPHTVTAYQDRLPEGVAFFASGGFGSQAAAESAWLDGSDGGLEKGETFTHEFTVPGEYPFYCIPHEASGMTGVVTVTE